MREPIVDPQSESEVLRAYVIMLIRLTDLSFSAWVKEPDGPLLTRNVTMNITIEEKLKGKVKQNAGEPFDFSVWQRGSGDSVVMEYYGLWSHVRLADGVRFLAFCQGESDDATVLLTENHCEQLLESDAAVEDTKAALALETAEISLSELLAQALKQASQRSDIFARYVSAKTKGEVLTVLTEAPSSKMLSSGPSATSPDEAFEGLVKLLEDPSTTLQARATYLTSMYEGLSMMPAPPRELVIRLIQAFFKLLTVPEAQPLHNNIKEVYLPNLLGLKNKPSRYLVSDVFPDPDQQSATLSSMKQAPPSQTGSVLIKWLEGKDE